MNLGCVCVVFHSLALWQPLLDAGDGIGLCQELLLLPAATSFGSAVQSWALCQVRQRQDPSLSRRSPGTGPAIASHQL